MIGGGVGVDWGWGNEWDWVSGFWWEVSVIKHLYTEKYFRHDTILALAQHIPQLPPFWETPNPPGCTIGSQACVDSVGWIATPGISNHAIFFQKKRICSAKRGL